MIHVCDAIMGSGKTESAITYMNEHKDQKFIFITPYLDEAARIKASCPDLHFVEPSNRIASCDFKKVSHTISLMEEGRNIATTHQAFKRYTEQMIDNIKRHGYTLVVDESVCTLDAIDVNVTDLNMLIDAGYIEKTDGTYKQTEKRYEGRLLAEFFDLIGSGNIEEVVWCEKAKTMTGHYWTLPPKILAAFKDVFILTYLFDSQGMKYMLEMNGMEYDHIWIDHSDGKYRFSTEVKYIPEYVKNIRNKIHILDKEKLNRIGDDETSLSMTWFQKSDNVNQLKNNIENCYKNIWPDSADRRLWATYSGAGGFSKLKGKGYTKSFLPFNARATNMYRDRKYLVYAANIFMNVGEKIFYEQHGCDVDQDEYALSIMIQWIWRSAIRDGEEIYIYIPSSRMRSLLINWMNSLDEE